MVLYDIAEELAIQDKTFRLDKFHEAFQGTDGQKCFRNDWEETKHRDINRFPTLLLKRGNQETICLSGYRSFDVLWKAVCYLKPELQDFELSTNISAYKEFWGSIVHREELEFRSNIHIHVD
jgi:predicted DsbA family dithiol-disulfide isomerase